MSDNLTKILLLNPAGAQLAFVDLNEGPLQQWIDSGWTFPTDELLAKINEALPSLLK